MPAFTPSAKEQIVLVAERLFAERGIDGVSLRQIGAAAGNGNNSAVQYHFGSKDRLVQAIFEYRLPNLYERRRLLAARANPNDLRSWVECYMLPVLEQGEQAGSHYLGFVSVLQQHGGREFFDRISREHQEVTERFQETVRSFLPDLPEPLRSHRIGQAMAFFVHAAAERERAQSDGRAVLPFSSHVGDLLDGLVGFLSAPATPATLATLDATDRDPLTWPLVP